MPAFLFWIFALVMLGFGAAVVLNRNPIASALSLVMCFMGLSALFMSLDAFFIGIIQVLVYAGAVMVLFLFIIMLLDLRVETRRKIERCRRRGRLGRGPGFLYPGLPGHRAVRAPRNSPSRLSALRKWMTSTVSAWLLFSNYNVPFQIIGVLVLVATIGVIVLSKRELR